MIILVTTIQILTQSHKPKRPSLEQMTSAASDTSGSPVVQSAKTYHARVAAAHDLDTMAPPVEISPKPDLRKKQGSSRRLKVAVMENETDNKSNGLANTSSGGGGVLNDYISTGPTDKVKSDRKTKRGSKGDKITTEEVDAEASATAAQPAATRTNSGDSSLGKSKGAVRLKPIDLSPTRGSRKERQAAAMVSEATTGNESSGGGEHLNKKKKSKKRKTK